MKNIKQLMILTGMALILTTVMQTNVFGQLLINEIESDTPPKFDNGCQYVELRGVAGSVVPANTYFLSIDGDAGNQGTVNEVFNLSGTVVGTNGTITLIGDPLIVGPCTGRVYGPGTTLLLSDNFFGLTGQDGETFLLVSTPAAINFSEGDDVDANNDGGNFDPQFPVTFLDGFAYVVDPASGRSYGGAPRLFSGGGLNLDVPDAATRFPGNTTPFTGAAFYYGELAASPNNTTQYAPPLSPNFPTGGMLTPGTPNVP